MRKLLRVYVTLRAVLGVFGCDVNSGTQFGSRDSCLSVVAGGVFQSTKWQGGVAHLSSDTSNSLNRKSPLFVCIVQSAGSSSSIPIFLSDNVL